MRFFCHALVHSQTCCVIIYSSPPSVTTVLHSRELLPFLHPFCLLHYPNSHFPSNLPILYLQTYLSLSLPYLLGITNCLCLGCNHIIYQTLLAVIASYSKTNMVGQPLLNYLLQRSGMNLYHLWIQGSAWPILSNSCMNEFLAQRWSDFVLYISSAISNSRLCWGWFRADLSSGEKCQDCLVRVWQECRLDIF